MAAVGKTTQRPVSSSNKSSKSSTKTKTKKAEKKKSAPIKDEIEKPKAANPLVKTKTAVTKEPSSEEKAKLEQRPKTELQEDLARINNFRSTGQTAAPLGAAATQTKTADNTKTAENNKTELKEAKELTKATPAEPDVVEVDPKTKAATDKMLEILPGMPKEELWKFGKEHDLSGTQMMDAYNQANPDKPITKEQAAKNLGVPERVMDHSFAKVDPNEPRPTGIGTWEKFLDDAPKMSKEEIWDWGKKKGMSGNDMVDAYNSRWRNNLDKQLSYEQGAKHLNLHPTLMDKKFDTYDPATEPPDMRPKFNDPALKHWWPGCGHTVGPTTQAMLDEIGAKNKSDFAAMSLGFKDMETMDDYRQNGFSQRFLTARDPFDKNKTYAQQIAEQTGKTIELVDYKIPNPAFGNQKKASEFLNVALVKNPFESGTPEAQDFLQRQVDSMKDHHWYTTFPPRGEAKDLLVRDLKSANPDVDESYIRSFLD